MSAPASVEDLGAKLGAVVVNYEAGAALIACVASLREGGLEDIVVADNASKDGSLVALAEADPRIGIVPLGTNLGYGRAANAGARRLSKPYLLICNPDLVFAPDAPTRLVSVLEAFPEAAVVGPRLVGLDGKHYPSARAFPSYGLAVAHGVASLIAPDNPFSRRYRREREAIEAAEVDWVSGACLALRADAFFSVGGFDERYFMYVEDLDLCWRLRRAGWSVRYEPAAVVVHEQGRSAARHPYRMLVAHHRSTWRFARRRVQGPARAALPLIGLGIGLRLGACLAQELARRVSMTKASQPAGGARDENRAGRGLD